MSGSKSVPMACGVQSGPKSRLSTYASSRSGTPRSTVVLVKAHPYRKFAVAPASVASTTAEVPNVSTGRW